MKNNPPKSDEPTAYSVSDRMSAWETLSSSNKVLFCYDDCPITRWQILDASKLEEFADDNFRFDENGRKLSKQVGNTVG